MEVILSNENDTFELAAQLAENLPKKIIIFLQGNLGAGKTTFVRGLLKALGHAGNVKSPTFTLVEPYNLKHHIIFHFDLYRVTHPEELDFIGMQDYFSETAICIIEWPQQAEGYLPAADLIISLDVMEENKRHCHIHALSELGKTCIDLIDLRRE